MDYSELIHYILSISIGIYIGRYIHRKRLKIQEQSTLREIYDSIRNLRNGLEICSLELMKIKAKVDVKTL
mgnify:CR=1 FL=1